MRPLSCPVSLFCDNNFHQKKLSHKFSIYFGDWNTFRCCSCYCLSRISLLDKTENWRQGNLCISVLVNFRVWIHSLLKLFNLQAFYLNKHVAVYQKNCLLFFEQTGFSGHTIHLRKCLLPSVLSEKLGLSGLYTLDRNLWSSDDQKGCSPEDQHFFNILPNERATCHDCPTQ